MARSIFLSESESQDFKDSITHRRRNNLSGDNKLTLESLSDIPGVGEKVKQSLIDHFGSEAVALKVIQDSRVPKELIKIMAQLRAEDGCPWDREQTHESLKRYLVEETAELMQLTAGQIGFALENTRLYAKLDKSYRSLEKAKMKIETYSKALDVELEKGRKIQKEFFLA